MTVIAADARPRGRPRRLLAILLGLLLALLGAELALRVDALSPGPPHDAAAARAYLTGIVEATSAGEPREFVANSDTVKASDLRPFGHPWVGWTDELWTQQVVKGCEWFAGPRADQTFDLLVLGGSFAADLANQCQQQFADGIADLPLVAGRPVIVWQATHAAWKQPQHQFALEWLFALGWRPDAVLVVDGFNEVAVSRENAYAPLHPLYPASGFWGTVAREQEADPEALDLLLAVRAAQQESRGRARTALGLGAPHSALLTRISERLVGAASERLRVTQGQYYSYLGRRGLDSPVHGPEFDQSPGAIVGLCVRAWMEAERSIRASCAARGIRTLHVIQPTLLDEGSKGENQRELAQGAAAESWREGVRLGYPWLRKGAARLATEGVAVYDGSRAFAGVEEQLYRDPCHLIPTEYARFAHAVLPHLREALR